MGAVTRATLQTAFDNMTTETYEETTTTGGLYSYTNRSFPTAYAIADADIKEVIYYDNYAVWQTDANYNFQSANAFHSQGLTKGLVTGMLIRNLETNDWYKSTNFVDYKGRIIQQHSQNNVGGIDRMDYQYRFNGEVLKMRMTHRKTGAKDLVELYEYAYDHAGRKTSFTHNNLVVSKYEYDNIGRLQTKKFRPVGTTQGSKQTGNWTDASSWLSGVFPLANDNVTINTGHILTIPSGQIASAGTLNDRGTLRNFGTLNMGKVPTADLYEQRFLYHIRGGIRGYNLDANGGLTNSLFSFKLSYEEGASGYFDGNIRNQYWKSSIDGVQRAYEYSYDKASRIISGAYGSTKAGENYALNGVTYDLNGNITTLSRNGYKSNNTFGLVDNLGYAYQTNSNKIQSVSDNSGEIASFTDATGATDYTYNLDGSLASDANKGITLIEYNYLKLPKRIVKGSTVILNQYDAGGNKLKETIGSNITDYSRNKIYKNGALYQVAHDEGRIIDGQYEYFINDHLGNLRVAFRDSSGVPKISQKQDYDPYGAELQKISYLKSSWKQSDFKYSGKEFIEETGLNDFGWRPQDPIIGRMWGVDYRAEKYYSQSPMQFALNNPISVVEVNGDTIRYNTDAQTTASIQSQIASYTNASPFFSYLMQYLELSENVININVGQTVGGVPGHFIPTGGNNAGGVGGTVTFLSGIPLNAQTVIEEFAHAAQLEMRPTLYPNVASSNIEYEAKVAVGLVGQDLEQKGVETVTPALNLGGLENSVKKAIMDGGTPYNNSKGMLDFSSANMATSQFQSYYTQGVKSFVGHWTAQGLPFGHTYLRKPSSHQPLMIQTIQKAIGR
jgi:RHS repeat-associated protein